MTMSLAARRQAVRRTRLSLARQILPPRPAPLWRLIYWPAKARDGRGRPAAILGPEGEILRLTLLEYRIVRGIYLTQKDTVNAADRYLAKVYRDDLAARTAAAIDEEPLPSEWVALHHYHGVDPADFR